MRVGLRTLCAFRATYKRRSVLFLLDLFLEGLDLLDALLPRDGRYSRGGRGLRRRFGGPAAGLGTLEDEIDPLELFDALSVELRLGALLVGCGFENNKKDWRSQAD